MWTFEIAIIFESMKYTSEAQVLRSFNVEDNHQTLEVLAPNGLDALALALREYPGREPIQFSVKRLRRLLVSNEALGHARLEFAPEKKGAKR